MTLTPHVVSKLYEEGWFDNNSLAIYLFFLVYFTLKNAARGVHIPGEEFWIEVEMVCGWGWKRESSQLFKGFQCSWRQIKTYLVCHPIHDLF